MNDQNLDWSGVHDLHEKNYPAFSGPDHRQTHAFDVDSDPVALFDKLFKHELWELLVTETNRYARQNNANNWQDTNLQEIRCFIGFLYGTSIHQISQLDDVWSTDWVLASPAFAKFFTRDRFWALFSNIHLVDNAKALDRRNPDFDKLYKIRPMILILKKSFKENYSLGQNVSVDEAMVKGNGRNPVKQESCEANKKRLKIVVHWMLLLCLPLGLSNLHRKGTR